MLTCLRAFTSYVPSFFHVPSSFNVCYVPLFFLRALPALNFLCVLRAFILVRALLAFIFLRALLALTGSHIINVFGSIVLI